MKRWLARGSALVFLTLSLSAACAGNDSKGGPPSAPCTDNSKSPLLCGAACSNKCGCSECAPGQTRQIEGVWYECADKCLTPQGAGGGGTGGGATGGTSATGGTGGIDCATVDCNLNPPLCGTCETCPCCNCPTNDLKNIGGKTYICTSNCYQLATDGG